MVETVKTPWHLWAVGVLSLLWNGFGAFDFVQTVARGEAYMPEAGFGDEMISYYNALPSWMYAPWVLGVWGAVIGSGQVDVEPSWINMTGSNAGDVPARMALFYVCEPGAPFADPAHKS